MMMISIRLYGLVALLIAGAAFVLGQMQPGLGVPFVALASTLWVGWSVHRSRARADDC